MVSRLGLDSPLYLLAVDHDSETLPLSTNEEIQSMTPGKVFRQLFFRIEGGDHRHRRALGTLQGVVTGLGNRRLVSGAAMTGGLV